ncbi:MAG TPA: hypothetical protein VJ724_08070 [Tahibacter sp.]|nr:hypothetical protein [Tahibacter sp.]
MLDDLIDRLHQALIANGWTIDLAPAPATLPMPLDGVDATLRGFVASTRSCESADGAVWFIGFDDYSRDDGEGWNFIQKQISEPSAEGMPDYEREVADFWSEHVPFAIHSRGDYGYLALSRAGSVVCGFAPELEEPQTVAASYVEFVHRLIEECERREGDFYDLWIKE